jgi:hypothetical protein
MSAGEMLKKDALTAAYRVAGNQILRAAKTALIKALKSNGYKSNHLRAMSEFLDTELGSAFLSAAIGTGLSYAPYFKDDERAQQMAKEFRINGMAVAGALALDTVMGDVLPTLLTSLHALPDPKVKTRFLDEADSDATPLAKAKSKAHE